MISMESALVGWKMTFSSDEIEVFMEHLSNTNYSHRLAELLLNM